MNWAREVLDLRSRAAWHWSTAAYLISLAEARPILKKYPSNLWIVCLLAAPLERGKALLGSCIGVRSAAAKKGPVRVRISALNRLVKLLITFCKGWC